MISDITILEQEPITLGELKKKIEEHKKAVEEPNFRVAKLEEYLNDFTPKKDKEIQELKKKIGEIGIQRLKERQMAKIIDLEPSTVDDLKAVLVGENITLKQEDMDKIVEVMKNA